MFSHGLVGLGLYVGWLITALYHANRRHDSVSIMLSSVLYIGVLQMFFYNMFSGSLPIMLVALGLVARPDDRRRRLSAPLRSTALGGTATTTHAGGPTLSERST